MQIRNPFDAARDWEADVALGTPKLLMPAGSTSAMVKDSDAQPMPLQFAKASASA